MALAICYLLSESFFLKLAITCKYLFLSLIVVRLVIFCIQSTIVSVFWVATKTKSANSCSSIQSDPGTLQLATMTANNSCQNTTFLSLHKMTTLLWQEITAYWQRRNSLTVCNAALPAKSKVATRMPRNGFWREVIRSSDQLSLNKCFDLFIPSMWTSIIRNGRKGPPNNQQSLETGQPRNFWALLSTFPK